MTEHNYEHREATSPIDGSEDGTKCIYKFERKLHNIQRGIVFIAYMTLGLIMFSQVVMRYWLDIPLLGIEELAPLAAVWIYFIGVSLATRDSEHVTGGILQLVVKNEKTILRVRLFNALLAIVVLVVFTYFAWLYVKFGIRFNKQSAYFRIPKFFWDVSMLTGFSLSLFYNVVLFVKEYTTLKQFTKKEKGNK